MSVSRWIPPPQPGPPIVITPRRAEVLTCLCRGMSYADIGRELYVTENTVRTHVRRLFRAAGARDRAHLVAITSGRQVIVYDWPSAYAVNYPSGRAA
jgi:DNA-binding NarL/FixJ family response regulator